MILGIMYLLAKFFFSVLRRFELVCTWTRCCLLYRIHALSELNALLTR